MVRLLGQCNLYPQVVHDDAPRCPDAQMPRCPSPKSRAAAMVSASVSAQCARVVSCGLLSSSKEGCLLSPGPGAGLAQPASLPAQSSGASAASHPRKHRRAQGETAGPGLPLHPPPGTSMSRALGHDRERNHSGCAVLCGDCRLDILVGPLALLLRFPLLTHHNNPRACLPAAASLRHRHLHSLHAHEIPPPPVYDDCDPTDHHHHHHQYHPPSVGRLSRRGVILPPAATYHITRPDGSPCSLLCNTAGLFSVPCGASSIIAISQEADERCPRSAYTYNHHQTSISARVRNSRGTNDRAQ